MFCGCASDEIHAPAAADAAALHDDDFKGCPPEVSRFAPGLHATGKQYALKLLTAMPQAPERYSNEWNVELDFLDGTAATDAHIVRSQTFMPVHGHDGRVVPVVTALASPAQFRVDRITFTMRGPWEARFWISGDKAEEDNVVLRVCVEK